jgi:hypothetical protein
MAPISGVLIKFFATQPLDMGESLLLCVVNEINVQRYVDAPLK